MKPSKVPANQVLVTIAIDRDHDWCRVSREDDDLVFVEQLGDNVGLTHQSEDRLVSLEASLHLLV